MKTLLAPILALGMFAVMVRGEIDQAVLKQYLSAESSQPLSLTSRMYAYWPAKRDSDPDTRVIDWQGQKSLLIYKDPEDNEKSVTQIVKEGIPKAEGMPDSRNVNLPADASILYSALLSPAGEVVCVVPGRNVPANPQECLLFNDGLVQVLIDSLDPNTPGIEDIHDPGAALIQSVLNELALQGPGALEAAKHDPVVVNILDALYESSQQYNEYHKKAVEQVEKFTQEQEAAEAALDEELGAEEGVNIEKRHNKAKGHHHHKKASNKRKHH
ncbi:hypothetical protein BGZ94_003733 [Podila epigama]|nr:hypothetical protein BGZ94_003733 [Podila epigama]